MIDIEQIKSYFPNFTITKQPSNEPQFSFENKELGLHFNLYVVEIRGVQEYKIPAVKLINTEVKTKVIRNLTTDNLVKRINQFIETCLEEREKQRQKRQVQKQKEKEYEYMINKIQQIVGDLSVEYRNLEAFAFFFPEEKRVSVKITLPLEKLAVLHEILKNHKT